MAGRAKKDRKLVLEWISGPLDGQRIEIGPGQTLSVGYDECAVIDPGGEGASGGASAEIHPEEKGWHLEPRDDWLDPDTPEPCIAVDGQAAMDTFRLWPGQVLRLGSQDLLVLEVDGEGPS